MVRWKSSPNLVWMDLEMSGLNPDKDVILEVATIVTDGNLNPLVEGPVLAVHQTENIFEGMDHWNKKHHSQSGLIDRCRKSNLTVEDCETMVLDLIKPYTEKGGNLLCGNSITQDRRFIYKYMPRLSEWLNYRNVDVSSIKELSFRWYPNLPEFKKMEVHQALQDIRESIAELQYYRKTIFKDQI